MPLDKQRLFLHASFTLWETFPPQTDISVTVIPGGILQESSATPLIVQEVLNFT